MAPHVPLARGWERQVDRERNALFYDERPITAARYRRWLDDNAVRFVALADAPIDYSAAREAAARARRARPYLREVWHDAHWRVFEVAGARPLAARRGARDRVEPERVRLTATAPGAVDLRVRFTPYWRIADRARLRRRRARRLDAAARRAPRTRGPRDLVRPRTGARDVAAMHALRAENRRGRRTTSGSVVPVRCG